MLREIIINTSLQLLTSLFQTLILTLSQVNSITFHRKEIHIYLIVN